ncbi:MAG: hypothetical protein LBL04_03200 [Bacteroidales bacterium]|nr:hypothetical protein [Bacteroidales bacterium]
MKKWMIVVFVMVMAVLVAMVSWFVYPRYKLYEYLKENNDFNSFQGLCEIITRDFLDYFYRFYQYPESSEDSVFRAPYYENVGYLPDIYVVYSVFVQKDTFLINDSIENVYKLYLKVPDHNKKHAGQIINSIDYENETITPVNMPFYKFLFSKGDILVGIIPEYNPCNYYYPNFAYKENLNVHDTIVHDSFRRTISIPYKQKYGMFPVYVRDFSDYFGLICYEANLYSDTLILTQVCEPFNGEYDTTPMVDVINKPLYTWAKDIGLHQFFFSIEVRPSFFEKKTEWMKNAGNSAKGNTSSPMSDMQR